LIRMRGLQIDLKTNKLKVESGKWKVQAKIFHFPLSTFHF